MKYSLYDIQSGEIVSHLTLPPATLAQNVPEGFATIAGHHEGRVVDGSPEPFSRPMILAGSIKAEAQRRIEARYPTWRQMNILRAGNEDEIEAMGRFIDAIRAASDVLDAMEAVPGNYADDHHWPEQTE